MKKIYLLLASVWLASVLPGCGPINELTPVSQANNVSAYPAAFLREWFQLQCRVVKTTPGFLPPQAARAFGYTGITVYEAVHSGIPGARSLAGQLHQLQAGTLPQADPQSIRYHWGLVANAAMAEMMRLMFDKRLTEENLQFINETEKRHYEQMSPEAASKYVAELSTQHGKAVALAIYDFSKTDGGHEAYLNPFSRPFTPVTGEDKWVPTDATNLTPLSPHWPKCRPMLASNLAFANTPRPRAFSTSPQSAFYKEALEVYNKVKNGTHEEREIARFWADDPFATCTPTGHTFNILTQLLEETGATLEKAAVAYAMLGVAENDAFIACWKSKYDYSLIRPVSYIQRYIDPDFQTVIGTPAFPSYTSGHATEAGAGERIFTKLFTTGDGNYPFTDRSQLQHGFSVRNFRSFQEAAEECANSRLYGGIHYSMDNQQGLIMGRSIGDNVLRAIQWPAEIR